MATNGDRNLRDARTLADDLEQQGQPRMATVIRSLCRTYEASRNVNSQLHADNAKLLAKLGDQS